MMTSVPEKCSSIIVKTEIQNSKPTCIWIADLINFMSFSWWNLGNYHETYKVPFSTSLHKPVLVPILMTKIFYFLIVENRVYVYLELPNLYAKLHWFHCSVYKSNKFVKNIQEQHQIGPSTRYFANKLVFNLTSNCHRSTKLVIVFNIYHFITWYLRSLFKPWMQYLNNIATNRQLFFVSKTKWKIRLDGWLTFFRT